MADSSLRYLVEWVYKNRQTAVTARQDMEALEGAGDKADRGQRKAGKAAEFLGGKLTTLVAGGALIAIGKQMLDFGKASISAASDVEEMSSKFFTVFKDLGPTVETALEEMAGAMNRSKYDLMGYAATFQDTFVPLGFARDDAADLSLALVGLAEDLASFNNLDTAQVAADLQSALVGNTETLRKYGVVAQETQIKQKALEMGLWDGKGAIDAQTKALTIYQLAMEGTADAQGDATRTAGSYANVQKGLSAAMQELQVVVGQQLLPTMTALAQIATVAIRDTITWANTQATLKQALDRGMISLGDYQKLLAQATFDQESQAEVVEYVTGLLGDYGHALADGRSKNKDLADAVVVVDDEFREHVGTVDDLWTAYDRMQRKGREGLMELREGAQEDLPVVEEKLTDVNTLWEAMSTEEETAKRRAQDYMDFILGQETLEATLRAANIAFQWGRISEETYNAIVAWAQAETQHDRVVTNMQKLIGPLRDAWGEAAANAWSYRAALLALEGLGPGTVPNTPVSGGSPSLPNPNQGDPTGRQGSTGPTSGGYGSRGRTGTRDLGGPMYPGQMYFSGVPELIMSNSVSHAYPNPALVSQQITVNVQNTQQAHLVADLIRQKTQEAVRSAAFR